MSMAMEAIRPVPFALGLATLAGAWLGPLPALARDAFWAHMSMHMAVVAVAAALLAWGVAGGRYDPALRAPRWFSPLAASLVEMIVVWGWHAPALHHWARHEPAALVAEQGSFLLTGLFLWLAAIGGDAARGGKRAAGGIVGLLLTSMHMTLLGALLALAPRPLYHASAGAGGLSALADQHLGGAVMLLTGGATYLAGGLWLTARVLRSGTGGRSGTARPPSRPDLATKPPARVPSDPDLLTKPPARLLRSPDPARKPPVRLPSRSDRSP